MTGRGRIVEDDGSESVYFTVPTGDQSQAILQVTFEPDYRPNAEEFEVRHLSLVPS